MADARVVGVPSEQWAETPVAFVVRRAGQAIEATLLHEDEQPRGQDLHDLRIIDELPRRAIVKVPKAEAALASLIRRPIACTSIR